MEARQLEMVTINDLVSKDHPYRRLKELLDFDKISKWAKIEECMLGATGYGKKRLTMCMVLQFMEDQSDRENERFLGENIAGKWFAGFTLTEKTPDYSTICKFRNAIGCKQVSKIFAEVKRQLQGKGYAAEVFAFVDATALTSKLAMWEERDKSIQDGYKKFNNEVIEKYAKDKDVRIGSKNSKKFWIGYKKHVGVDAQSGIITKVAVTKANVTDAAGAKHVIPNSGAVLADKGYVGAIGDIKALLKIKQPNFSMRLLIIFEGCWYLSKQALGEVRPNALQTRIWRGKLDGFTLENSLLRFARGCFAFCTI